MNKQDIATIAERLARIERAIEQVNFNEAERYRMTRDGLMHVMEELHKPRKKRRSLDIKEPPLSSWSP